jgi:hypothetical protein
MVLLFAQAPLFLHAQSNFKPGYIIDNKSDTLKGFIDYREWLKNPKEISFKQTEAAPAQKFTVANAHGFAISDAEYYDRFVVNVSTSPVELSKLSHSLDTAYRTDTVFLQNLVNGKNVSLYAWTDELKSSYYLFNKQTHTIEYLRQYLYFDEESRSVTGVNGYISQLTRLAYQYLPGNTPIITRIRKANYAESDLTAIVIALNGGKATQQAVHSNAGVRFFAGAGLRYSKLQFNSSVGQAGPFSNGIHDNAISPVIAAGMDLLINKYTEKLLFRLEITGALNSYHFSEPSATDIITNALDVKVYHFAAVPQIMYNFYSTDKLKAFIDLGVAINLYKYNNYNYTTTYHYSTATTVITQNKYPDFQGFEFSLPVKAGVQINKRIEVYGTYWLPSSLTKYLYFSADQSAFQAGVNYIFR